MSLFFQMGIYAKGKGTIFVERRNSAVLYVATMEKNAAFDADGSILEGHFSGFITIESPREWKGHRLEVLFTDKENSVLTKLGTKSGRMAFRLRAGALRTDTDFIYDSEITDAFNADAIPSEYRHSGDLDKYLDVPMAGKPKYPASLPSTFVVGVSKFLVLVDSQGEMLEAIPFGSTHSDIKESTLKWITALKYKKGTYEKKPTPYYLLFSVVYRGR